MDKLLSEYHLPQAALKKIYAAATEGGGVKQSGEFALGQ